MIQPIVLCICSLIVLFVFVCDCAAQPTDETGVEDTVEDDTTESDTCSTDVNRKRAVDSSEESESADIPRIKAPCVDAENVTSD